MDCFLPMEWAFRFRSNGTEQDENVTVFLLLLYLHFFLIWRSILNLPNRQIKNLAEESHYTVNFALISFLDGGGNE